jgi:hypothetical protein
VGLLAQTIIAFPIRAAIDVTLAVGWTQLLASAEMHHEHRIHTNASTPTLVACLAGQQWCTHGPNRVWNSAAQRTSERPSTHTHAIVL